MNKLEFSKPKYDRHTYICPNCKKNSNHTTIEFAIAKKATTYIDYDVPDSVFFDGVLIDEGNIYYTYLVRTDSNKWNSLDAEDINRDVWKHIFPDDKTLNNFPLKHPLNSPVYAYAYEPTILIFIKVCNSCGNRLIYDGKGYKDDDKNIKLSNQNLTNFEIDEPNEYMPKELKTIYNEAKSISKLSPKSSSALLRYILEQLLIKKFPNFKSQKLYDMLNDPELKHEIGAELVKIGDSLRIIGNKSIHNGLEININELEDNIDKLFDWINCLSNELFKNYDEISANSSDLVDRIKNNKK